MEQTLMEQIVNITRHHPSPDPVTAALYTVEVVMNEDDFKADNEAHVEAFAKEFQRALDHGFFADLRYDAMTFEVKREIIHTEPGKPE